MFNIDNQLLNTHDPVILAIETSCDDTCIAIMRGRQCLASNISSQDHSRLGGVFPEYASRQHLELINPSMDLALRESGISIHDIDAIAVTKEPGLRGSLLVGYAYAKMLAHLLNKRLIEVNHLHGHILSAQYACNIPFPYGFLLVSGGHSMIGIAHAFDNYEILGRTADDAAGECFDKVARSLGLQQPWGPSLEQYALTGTPIVKLPMPLQGDHTCNMSFSGLKTACIRAIDNGCNKADLAASFQNTVALFLRNRIQNAIHTYPHIQNWGVVGGVAANQVLRSILMTIDGCSMHFPPLKLCTDNAVMIGYAGWMRMYDKS